MSENAREYILNKLGESHFAVDKDGDVPAMAQNKRKFVTLYVLRKTIAPFIDRSDDPESTITQVISDAKYGSREVIEVPARKFKSKEKLMGLKICRAFDLVDPKYEYNSISAIEYLNNPNSVIYGDTVVEGGDAGQAMLPSRVLYSSSYSIRERSRVTKRLTHNSLSEAGTMWDHAKGSNRTSLFNSEYVVPDTFFPSFITLLNPTPEIIVHVLMCLEERSYGAQTSITGPNFKNSVPAIVAGEFELPITSYTVTKALSELSEKEMLPDDFERAINDRVIKLILEEKPDVVLHGSEIDEFIEKLSTLTSSDLDAVYRKLKEDSNDLIVYSNIIKKKKKRNESISESDSGEEQ